MTFGLLLLLSAAGAGVYFYVRSADKLSKLPPLPVDAYLAGGNLWSDEEYKLEGRIDNVIYRSDDRSTLVVSVQPTGSTRRLPVVVKPDAKKKPLQREQVLVLKISVGAKKQLVCSDYASR